MLDEPEHLAGPPFNSTISHLPYGVTTIVIPFNWPLAILAASLPHALMAGNTVVVKPPPTTPLSVVETLRHVAKVLPPGVLNVITGHDAVVGSPVIEDPRVQEDLLHRQHQWRPQHHEDGEHQPGRGHPRARRQRPGDHPRGRDAR